VQQVWKHCFIRSFGNDQLDMIACLSFVIRGCWKHRKDRLAFKTVLWILFSFIFPLRTSLFMGRGGAATRGQGIPTGVAFRVQRATTKRSYAEFSAIDIKVFYCYLVLYGTDGRREKNCSASIDICNCFWYNNACGLSDMLRLGYSRRVKIERT